MQINRILTKLCQSKLDGPVIMPHRVELSCPMPHTDRPWYADIVTLNFDLLYDVYCLWHSTCYILLPSLNSVWLSFPKLWHISCLGIVWSLGYAVVRPTSVMSSSQSGNVHVSDSDQLIQAWLSWVPTPPLLSHSRCYARQSVHFVTTPLKAWAVTKATLDAGM